MKKAVALAIALLSGLPNAMAASSWDGAYQCSATSSLGSMTAYQVILGHADGIAIWSNACPQSTQCAGFGVGTIAGNTFAGNTDEGLAFSFTMTGNQYGGTVNSKENGVPHAWAFSCTKIW